VLKGATGAGAPIIAVPALAMMVDVRFAVTVMLVPNLVTNLVQGWTYRSRLLAPGFVLAFAGGGAAGALLGSWLLAAVPGHFLTLGVALAVAAYIALRLLHPGWTLAYEAARRLALPVGGLGGLLQGASGVSAPVSISFLNAMRLERPVFIATISLFFAAMGSVQIPALALFGVLTRERLLVSALALAPLLAGMPLGARLARQVSPRVFDRFILVLLGALALKLAADAILG
jgi:uncharacterized protein